MSPPCERSKPFDADRTIIGEQLRDLQINFT